MIQFRNEDAAYSRWISDTANQAGYVVNSYRVPDQSYLVLHRATCHSISGQPTNGKSWTRDYTKTCSGDLTELKEWSEGEIHRALTGCGLCKPLSSTDSAAPEPQAD